MSFSIHLGDRLTEQLNRAAQESGKARNALIREAVEEWLKRRQARKWPSVVMNFRGIKGIPRFEKDRKLLKPPRKRFGALSS